MDRVEVRLGDVVDRRPILTRPMVLLLIASVCSPASFYLLMPVVPLYLATAGLGGVGAGMSTGALMLGTVLMEFAVPGLLRRYGYRLVMAAGPLLLGAPALALVASSALPLVLVVCVVRGAGLGIVVVAGSALVAELVPADRRGEGLGLYGVAVAVPSIVCLPLGLWLAGNVGYGPVFVIGAALSLLALAAVPGLPARPARPARIERAGVLGVLRIRGLAGPAVVFATVTLAAGALLTFLPMAVPAGSHHVAAWALLVQSCAAPLARWGAGWYGDRHGTARLLVPAVLAAAVGTAVLVWTGSPVAVMAGMGLFGLGFGLAQNVTLAQMFARASESDFGRVSALWNLAYDGGMGVGAVAFGLLSVPLGYPVAFAVTALVLCTALVPAWLAPKVASKGDIT
ncbi:MFS transporter [Sphaerisporangium melleum]|uniref:MFS transporter n=1 Tax=Sphaerisporangium melleum TaxID=321316 RepID=A0A917QQW6_9ACTN|nr:MFS transporter [Sphaerisporangium melleum]GII68137.1 MFS transporter [Sphaerisporangium melleum]